MYVCMYVPLEMYHTVTPMGQLMMSSEKNTLTRYVAAPGDNNYNKDCCVWTLVKAKKKGHKPNGVSPTSRMNVLCNRRKRGD